MTQKPAATSGTQDVGVDLTNCDSEPIHVPGAIQPHGVLLTLTEPELRVVQVSDNVQEVLGQDPAVLLGQDLAKLLGEEQAEALKATLETEELKAANPIKLNVGSPARVVNGILHRHNGVLILELEPTGQPVASPLLGYQRLQTSLAKVQAARTLHELLNLICAEVRALLGYDRVMVYRFNRAGDGEVVAESAKEGLEQFLGLHYPATDIPQQARLLYSLNWVRHIPDVTYAKSDLIPLIYPATKELTDLTHSTLRSVSPMHVEYLQNMNVASSLSVSIMHGARLWGLVACHHYSPKFVPYESRVACELLGQVTSLRMASLESEEQTLYKSEANVQQAKFLQALASSQDLKQVLLDGSPNLLNYIKAGGCAVCTRDSIALSGETPSREQVAGILKLMRRIQSPVFATDDLKSTFPEAEVESSIASGLLGVAISKKSGIYLLWFRPEQVRTVNWGGDPNKAVPVDPNSRLHPRKSFELWKEVVRNRSLPWSALEVQAATELRSTLTALLLQDPQTQKG